MSLLIDLSVVIVACDGETPRVLATRQKSRLSALPFGVFDPDQHRTFELALRGWVKQQTGFRLGYVEQLYTFGDRNREGPETALSDRAVQTRTVSVGYLALTPQAERVPTSFEAGWHNWYRHFPWEDHRKGRPTILDAVIAPHLRTWSSGNKDRQSRAEIAFGFNGKDWLDENVLERYELLYEAGLVEECARDHNLSLPNTQAGTPMTSDHRRILATAIARLRAKIRYRPIIFDLMPNRFTLSGLQHTVEALLGCSLHKQNFRRALNRTGFVEGTTEMDSSTGGRPAELFRFKHENVQGGNTPGLSVPIMKSN